MHMLGGHLCRFIVAERADARTLKLEGQFDLLIFLFIPSTEIDRIVTSCVKRGSVIILIEESARRVVPSIGIELSVPRIIDIDHPPMDGTTIRVFRT